MEDTQVDIQTVLKHMREIIAVQAQEIAVLKATLETYTANT